MILIVQRIYSQASLKFSVDTIPQQEDIIEFEGRMYFVCNVIELTSHTVALVKKVDVLKLNVSQVLEINNE